MYLPFNYEKINIAAGHYSPSMVKAYNNQTFAYYFRSLYERACSVFDFTLPDTWNGPVKDFFYYCLLRFGFVGVWNEEEYGLVFNPGTLNKFNFYYQPVNFKVSNPALKGLSKDLKLGADGEAELIKLTPDYLGIFDIIGKYAEQLSALELSINTSIINSKVSFVLGARNMAAASSLKVIMDKYMRGEPAIIFDRKLTKDNKDKEDPFQLVEIKADYLGSTLLQDFMTVLNNFDSEIGIPTTPYQKAERMTKYESEAQTIDSTARAVTWKRTLDDSIDIVNEHFGTDIKCEFRYEPSEEIPVEDQEGDDNNEQL